MVVSTARLKGKESVSQEHYLRRVELIAVHEVGHDLIQASHYRNTTWVNTGTGYRFSLGPHCTDNQCGMYEIVDIKAPPASEGYLRLGRERRYDAGLDDVLERMHPDFLCGRCSSSIEK